MIIIPLFLLSLLFIVVMTPILWAVNGIGDGCIHKYLSGYSNRYFVAKYGDDLSISDACHIALCVCFGFMSSRSL